LPMSRPEVYSAMPKLSTDLYQTLRWGYSAAIISR